MRRTFIALASALLVSMCVQGSSIAYAQGVPPQQLPPPQQQPGQYPPQQYPQQQYPQQQYPQQPPPGYGQPPDAPPPQQPYYYPPQQQPPRQAPPPMEYVEPEPPTHAPKFSLWAGARISYMGFGLSWYQNAPPASNNETTGSLAGNGVAPELDLGARISHRYIPYVFIEHGFLAKGHRFKDVSDASASTDFYGIGFRILSGDADSVSFVSDLAIGKRVVTVRNGNDTYSMSGLEIFRLGFGADIRLATLFTLSPMLSISSGSMNDTSGSVTWPDGGDGVTKPRYQNGQTIDDSGRYIMLSLGVGIHFDIFGK